MSARNPEVNLAERLARTCLITSFPDKASPILRWDSWAMYLDPVLVREVEDRLVSIGSPGIAEVDYICPIPMAGLPLGATFQRTLGKPIITLDWNRQEIRCRERVKWGASVALIDTVLQTGHTLDNALQVLDSIGGRFTRHIVIAYDDLCPVVKVHKQRNQYLQEGKIEFLYKFSELVGSN